MLLLRQCGSDAVCKRPSACTQVGLPPPCPAMRLLQPCSYNRAGLRNRTCRLRLYTGMNVSTLRDCMHVCAGDALVQLQEVTLCTPNYENALFKGLSLTVAPGDRLLVMGPSGCGKTSLLRCLGGLWTAGTGTIETPPIAQVKVCTNGNAFGRRQHAGQPTYFLDSPLASCNSVESLVIKRTGASLPI